MKSVRTIWPLTPTNVVSRIFVFSMYRRLASESCTGRMLQWPPRFESKTAPKIDGLSNRGQQSQSSDARFEINAAERPLPMIA